MKNGLLWGHTHFGSALLATTSLLFYSLRCLAWANSFQVASWLPHGGTGATPFPPPKLGVDVEKDNTTHTPGEWGKLVAGALGLSVRAGQTAAQPEQLQPRGPGWLSVAESCIVVTGEPG